MLCLLHATARQRVYLENPNSTCKGMLLDASKVAGMISHMHAVAFLFCVYVLLLTITACCCMLQLCHAAAGWQVDCVCAVVLCPLTQSAVACFCEAVSSKDARCAVCCKRSIRFNLLVLALWLPASNHRQAQPARCSAVFHTCTTT